MIAWIRSNLSSSKSLLASILLLGTITVVFAVGLMFVAGYLISASADNVYSLLMLNIPLAFVQIFGLGKPIVRYLERLKSHDWVLRLTSELRYKLFRAVQSHLRKDKRFRTGELLGSLASDIEHAQNLYLRTVFPVLIAWLSGLLLVAIAATFSLGLLLFALGMLVLLCVILPLLSIAIDRARIDRIDAMRTGLYAALTDRVLGAQDIAIAGRGASESAHFVRAFDDLHQDEHRKERTGRVILLLVQALLLVVLIVVVWYATQRFGGAVGGNADWIVAAALGFFPLIEVFAPLSRQFEDGLSHRESLQRLDERGFLHGSEQERPVSVRIDSLYAISIENLTFSYDGSHKILDDVSLEIPFGQKIAILGKSGSGKTTLARSIHGDIEQNAGSIKIADVPVSDLRHDIWDHIGLISQNSYIFAMSIIDNLRIGKIDISEAEAWQALEQVGLKSYVESLPEGLEAMADEAGLNFSGGQRQRLALARVLLQDPPIVILDEPTVGLDPMTEQMILDTIGKAFSEKTIVMITHHLQGVDAFDRAIFLEEGSIAMDGDPSTLALCDERYRKLLAFDRGSFA